MRIGSDLFGHFVIGSAVSIRRGSLPAAANKYPHTNSNQYTNHSPYPNGHTNNPVGPDLGQYIHPTANRTAAGANTAHTVWLPGVFANRNEQLRSLRTNTNPSTNLDPNTNPG